MKFRTLAVALLAVWLGLGAAGAAVAADDRRSSISGTAYFDANVNGRPDAQERAIRNLQIDIEGPNGFKDTKKTADSGTYEFENLAAGKYKLTPRLPNGYGLSEGEPSREISVDGRTVVRNVDFAVARSEQIPQGGVRPAPALPTQQPVPTSPSAGAVPPWWSPNGGQGQAPPPAQSAPPQSSQPAPPSGNPGGPSGGSSGGSSPFRPAPQPPAAQPTTPPTPTAVATPTSLPASAYAPTPAPTSDLPPTRTPPPLDAIQVASERGRAALTSPQEPRTASTRQGDGLTLDVPFRSMWDGSDYADTNSGSATIAMVLEAYGYRAETGDVRALANILGRTFDVSQPPRIEMLARIGELSSVRGIGLYQGVRLSNWTADDVREKLRAGYPVLTLVRTDGPDTAGDLGAERFVVIVGLKDNNFVYHDPTYQDDRGAGRTLTERALVKAWASSSGSSQAVAFGLGQAQLGLFSPLEDLLEAQREPTRPTTNGMRDVPTPGPIQPLGPLSQLIPVPTPVPEEVQATPGSPIGAFHPLFLAFWAVAGVVAVKAVVSLLME